MLCLYKHTVKFKTLIDNVLYIVPSYIIIYYNTISKNNYFLTLHFTIYIKHQYFLYFIYNHEFSLI